MDPSITEIQKLNKLKSKLQTWISKSSSTEIDIETPKILKNQIQC